MSSAVKKTAQSLFIAAMMLAPASSAFATPVGNFYRISKVQVVAAGGIKIGVQGNYAAAHGCNRSWADTAHGVDDARGEAILRLMSSALLADKEVFIETDGCSAGGYPLITLVQLRD